MSIEKSVLEKLLKLPADKQKEVLDFVETLEKKAGAKGRRHSLKGLWADLEGCRRRTLLRCAAKCRGIGSSKKSIGLE